MGLTNTLTRRKLKESLNRNQKYKKINKTLSKDQLKPIVYKKEFKAVYFKCFYPLFLFIFSQYAEFLYQGNNLTFW